MTEPIPLKPALAEDELMADDIAQILSRLDAVQSTLSSVDREVAISVSKLETIEKRLDDHGARLRTAESRISVSLNDVQDIKESLRAGRDRFSEQSKSIQELKEWKAGMTRKAMGISAGASVTGAGLIAGIIELIKWVVAQ